MTSNLKYATCPTPKVSDRWAGLNDSERKESVEAALAGAGEIFLNDFKVLSCNADGQVIVSIEAVMGPTDRGTKLLDLEEALKNKVDQGIAVWAVSLGDKNSLRNLRGIEVK